jgi:hypothetical protein
VIGIDPDRIDPTAVPNGKFARFRMPTISATIIPQGWFVKSPYAAMKFGMPVRATMNAMFRLSSRAS